MKDPIDTIELWKGEAKLQDNYLTGGRIISLCKALKAARNAIIYAYEDTSDQFYLNKLEEMEDILKGEEIPKIPVRDHFCSHGTRTDESCLYCEDE